jgi:hypothetical protein
MADVAPIYSTEDARRAESAAWERFSAAKDTAEFCNSWLAVLCMQIERANGSLLLLGPDQQDEFSPAAVYWFPITREDGVEGAATDYLIITAGADDG